jgi:hypothetical protein
MSLGHYQLIDQWTEADLHDQLAGEGESDEYEFKSSKIGDRDLMKELQVAASAFWNSGGGVLFVGVDDNGNIDGGIRDVVGRQRLRDWVDRVLSRVEPEGPYLVKLIYAEGSHSAIAPGHAVLVVAYGESNNAPHMAPDKRYYVRAGAHSDPAGHFLVEAIRARRRLQKPVLRGLLRTNPHLVNAVELVVVGLNDTPALDVRLSFDGLPEHIRQAFDERLPLYIPVIDRAHPFAMDATWFGLADNGFGEPVVQLRLNYQDLAGRQYEDTQRLDPSRNIAPFVLPEDNGDALSTPRSLQDLTKQVKRLRQAIERAETSITSDG